MKLGKRFNLVVAVLAIAVVAALVFVAARNQPGSEPFWRKSPPPPDEVKITIVRPWAPETPLPSPPASEPAFAWDNSADFPMSGRGKFIYLPTTWAGKTARFAVDTGAAINVVDSAVFPDLPNPTQQLVRRSGEPGKSGLSSETVCDPPALKVGPFDLERGGQVARLDLSAIFQNDQPPVIGVIGIPSIRQRAIQLDFNRLCFRFLNPSTANRQKWGTAIPLSVMHEQLLAADVSSGGHRWQAVVDTGCELDGAIQTTLVDQMTDASLVSSGGLLNALGLTNNSARARIPESLVFGDGPIEYHLVTLQDAGTGDNLVGIRLLSRASMVTIDPVNRLMYVKP